MSPDDSVNMQPGEEQNIFASVSSSTTVVQAELTGLIPDFLAAYPQVQPGLMNFRSI